MTGERRTRSTEAFFGRRRGKTLRPRQAEQLERLLPQWRIDLAAAPPAALASLFAHAPNRIILEIGFGGGEHLLHRALESPETGFIGVEPFVNSMAKFVSAAEDAGVTNVRLHDDDATQLLDWLPPACLDGIDLLYPDPWPKMRHWKRRFVNRGNLDRFARVLKPGGRFRFASDIDTYVNWTLHHIHAHPDFDWPARNAGDWREPYPGWPGTRYEAKALREGRTPAYLTFRRT
ncbi:tRNA (guanine(46)-N(7))-methyltransferase TrmB [Oricola sp.]|uniref:tRNA (guanine(46)-N(7))-methyltransferase TrmB n=1 Tax=Oricola sp. TaxID=1979950 RepID=UPI0025F75356|nr:tRNA (guanine(46)-N(7))-methyltransferase TrmB [Oricola sp.]MCI5077996.1 tRNA (guanine(46)-N(7))-methyltransferase TrmB [Oricola sp.]